MNKKDFKGKLSRGRNLGMLLIIVLSMLLTMAYAYLALPVVSKGFLTALHA